MVTAVKNHMTDDHRLFRLAFAQENIIRDWKRVILSDNALQRYVFSLAMMVGK